MKLAHSIAKAGQPLTYCRAWRRLRRTFHPVPVAPLLAQIDQKRLMDLRAKHESLASDSPTLWRHYSKYLDIEKHVRQNICRAQDLNLHRLPSQEILDIGCGGGFFLFVAQRLGHDGLGLDVGGIPLFDDLIELLRVSRLEYRVTGFQRLPDLGRKFDLIVAFATAFHGGHEDVWRWSEQEWEFFLTDLKQRLKPGGRIFFDLNAAYDGAYYTSEILSVFLDHGGVVERNRILFASTS